MWYVDSSNKQHSLKNKTTAFTALNYNGQEGLLFGLSLSWGSCYHFLQVYNLQDAEWGKHESNNPKLTLNRAFKVFASLKGNSHITVSK